MNDTMPGTLYLVATPIGNLEDITLRAIRILREVDCIACEDTRHTARLLTHHGIATRRESYHEHNEASRTPELIGELQEGRSIALVSDAGTPLLSDPGMRLVAACREAGIPVVPVPGPSAAIAALSASGLDTGSFLFAGFLPPKSSARMKRLGELAGIEATLVFYEAPHRIVGTLREMAEALGDRPACLARELTKIHEEWLRGPLSTIADTLAQREVVKGEITLIVSGATLRPAPEDVPESIDEHLRLEIESTGLSRKEALKSIARKRGLTRREAYKLLLGGK